MTVKNRLAYALILIILTPLLSFSCSGAETGPTPDSDSAERAINSNKLVQEGGELMRRYSTTNQRRFLDEAIDKYIKAVEWQTLNNMALLSAGNALFYKARILDLDSQYETQRSKGLKWDPDKPNAERGGLGSWVEDDTLTDEDKQAAAEKAKTIQSEVNTLARSAIGYVNLVNELKYIGRKNWMLAYLHLFMNELDKSLEFFKKITDDKYMGQDARKTAQEMIDLIKANQEKSAKTTNPNFPDEFPDIDIPR